MCDTKSFNLSRIMLSGPAICEILKKLKSLNPSRQKYCYLIHEMTYRTDNEINVIGGSTN